MATIARLRVIRIPMHRFRTHWYVTSSKRHPGRVHYSQNGNELLNQNLRFSELRIPRVCLYLLEHAIITCAKATKIPYKGVEPNFVNIRIPRTVNGLASLNHGEERFHSQLAF